MIDNGGKWPQLQLTQREYDERYIKESISLQRGHEARSSVERVGNNNNKRPQHQKRAIENRREDFHRFCEEDRWIDRLS
jgi:hypothetical protein